MSNRHFFKDLSLSQTVDVASRCPGNSSATSLPRVIEGEACPPLPSRG